MRLVVKILLLVVLINNLSHSQHIGEFVSLGGGSQTSDFVFPSTHTFQYIIEEGQILSSGSNMRDRLDFTGYVPINGSSIEGYLSISHELGLGGVTILDISFDSIINSWEFTTTQEVDFSSVFETSKNCSGTVTP